METLINVLSLIPLLTVGSHGRISLTLNMILFHIILPYAYLANTSHNKDRIVKEGWENVLKNIFPCTRSTGRTSLTRIYQISQDPETRHNKGAMDNDIVITRVIHNELNGCTADNSAPHIPIQQRCAGTGGAGQEKNQNDPATSSGMENIRPYLHFFQKQLENYPFYILHTNSNIFLNSIIYLHSGWLFLCRYLATLPFHN